MILRKYNIYTEYNKILELIQLQQYYIEYQNSNEIQERQEIPKEILQSQMVINESVSKTLEQEADKIPSEITEQIAAIGRPAQIIEILEKYKKIGANHFLIKFLGQVSNEDFKKFNSEIIHVMNNT